MTKAFGLLPFIFWERDERDSSQGSYAVVLLADREPSRDLVRGEFPCFSQLRFLGKV
jgi:hypothetical protein